MYKLIEYSAIIQRDKEAYGFMISLVLIIIP